MRVLFVHHEEDHCSVERPIESHERIQFGISYLSSFLKSYGHETKLVVPTRKTMSIVEKYVGNYEPGLVCFTSVYSVFGYLSEIAGGIKERFPDVFLLVGGPHASLNPQQCLKEAYDAVCIGEGEHPTLELTEMLESGREPEGIPNLYIKHGGEVEMNEPRPWMENIEELPYPDREMWLPWLTLPLSRPSVLAGRGCPFKCTYCCNHALSGLAEGRYVRLRPPQDIVEELLELKRLTPLLEEVYLEVETLGANKRWTLELCSHLERMNEELDIPMRFGSNLRVTPNMDFEGIFSAMRRGGFFFINIGLESGSERIRKDVLNRYYSNGDIQDAVFTARKYGLDVGMYNMIGIPGETRRDFRKTASLNRKCQPDWFLLSAFFPYPGTRLYENCLQQGLLDASMDQVLERRRPSMELPGFSKRQMKRRYTLFPLMIYFGRKPISGILRAMIMSIVFSHRRLLDLWRDFRWRFHFRKQFGS